MALNTAKVRSLTTRSQRSSDLAFEVAGMIDWQNADIKVGTRIPANRVISGDALRAQLEQRASDEQRSIASTPSGISSFVAPGALFRLRNIQEHADLTQAIANRDVQVLRTFRKMKEIAAAVQKAARESDGAAAEALKARDRIHEEIQKAYTSEPADSPWRGVRKSLATLQTTEGESVSELFMTPTGLHTPTYAMNVTAQPNGSKQAVDDVVTKPALHNGSAWVDIDTAVATASKTKLPDFYAQRTVSKEESQKRRSLSETQGFWHPQLESALDYFREREVLIGQQLARAIGVLSVERVEAVLERELASIEAEVLKAQSRYVSTFVLAPFEGVVTAIYKDVGEHVQAGEPVIRVESDTALLLFGHLLFRGSLRIGQSVQVRSKNIHQSGNDLSVSGRVVSVRGHSADDDEWEVLIELAAGTQLPLNFSFDPTDTQVIVS